LVVNDRSRESRPSASGTQPSIRAQTVYDQIPCQRDRRIQHVHGN
jgi:hypothetical protein